MKIVDPKFRIDDYEFRRLSVSKLRDFEVIIYVSKTVYFKSKTFIFNKKQLISWEVMKFCTINTFQIRYWIFSLSVTLNVS